MRTLKETTCTKMSCMQAPLQGTCTQLHESETELYTPKYFTVSISWTHFTTLDRIAQMWHGPQNFHHSAYNWAQQHSHDAAHYEWQQWRAIKLAHPHRIIVAEANARKRSQFMHTICCDERHTQNTPDANTCCEDYELFTSARTERKSFRMVDDYTTEIF